MCSRSSRSPAQMPYESGGRWEDRGTHWPSLRQLLTGANAGRQRTEPEQQLVLTICRPSSPGVIAFAASTIWPAPTPSARHSHEP